MNRFRSRLNRADARISRAFAEELPAELLIGEERRPVVVIFESPDMPVSVQGGGEIQDHSPAFSAMTVDIAGLSKNDEVEINAVSYRVTLGYGRPGKLQPEINRWS